MDGGRSVTFVKRFSGVIPPVAHSPIKRGRICSAAGIPGNERQSPPLARFLRLPCAVRSRPARKTHFLSNQRISARDKKPFTGDGAVETPRR